MRYTQNAANSESTAKRIADKSFNSGSRLGLACLSTTSSSTSLHTTLPAFAPPWGRSGCSSLSSLTPSRYPYGSSEMPVVTTVVERSSTQSPGTCPASKISFERVEQSLKRVARTPTANARPGYTRGLRRARGAEAQVSDVPSCASADRKRFELALAQRLALESHPHPRPEAQVPQTRWYYVGITQVNHVAASCQESRDIDLDDWVERRSKLDSAFK